MTPPDFSVALTEAVDDALAAHLLRPDGQEDICLATYAVSTGATRQTALIREVHLPDLNERLVHGNATITGSYVLRVARIASQEGLGIAILHSHPRGRNWQGLSMADAEAEVSYQMLTETLTGLPLVGMTLAGGDRRWSARRWTSEGKQDAISVRTIGSTLRLSFNEDLIPSPAAQARQRRTVDSWGPNVQNDVARMRVLVVGVGSVGLDIALRLAATGVRHVAVMDPDIVKLHNLDRLIGACATDALLATPKVAVARREMLRAGTAEDPQFAAWQLDVTTPDAEKVALDYDLIFSCVDRPLPRAVLNQIAYADLIPVIDGGIAIDVFEDGSMRNATWRSHIARPGRPCLLCNGQIGPTQVAQDRDGSLDDPAYIAAAGVSKLGRQNVAVLSASVSSGLLALFTSLVASPGGRGEPGPLQYVLSTHTLKHLPATSLPHCRIEQRLGIGDHRSALARLSSPAFAGSHDRRALLVRWARAGVNWASGRLDAYSAAAVERRAH
jgi:molybdopterin/thiamine biosynthesis adenylyltransferase